VLSPPKRVRGRSQGRGIFCARKKRASNPKDLGFSWVDRKGTAKEGKTGEKVEKIRRAFHGIGTPCPTGLSVGKKKRSRIKTFISFQK